ARHCASSSQSIMWRVICMNSVACCVWRVACGVWRVACCVTNDYWMRESITAMEFTRYVEWEQSVPEVITKDALWRMEVYRLALFVADLAWCDVTRLMGDRRTLGLTDQLYRAVCSIGANIAEGYSRNSAKDRARFYEYALGSARESRDWYYKGRAILGDSVTEHRLTLVTQLIRLLLTIVPAERKTVKDDTVLYDIADLPTLTD
ncbi:MAG: four helix bundle protein, partial [Caldilinea sp.]